MKLTAHLYDDDERNLTTIERYNLDFAPEIIKWSGSYFAIISQSEYGGGIVATYVHATFEDFSTAITSAGEHY